VVPLHMQPLLADGAAGAGVAAAAAAPGHEDGTVMLKCRER
jgi:hypothetical protein